jgi:hypothetical protein
MDGLPGWAEPDSDVLGELARHAARAASIAVINSTATQAGKIRTAVRAALRVLLANGLITATPAADWPKYVMIDPPAAEPAPATQRADQPAL